LIAGPLHSLRQRDRRKHHPNWKDEPSKFDNVPDPHIEASCLAVNLSKSRTRVLDVNQDFKNSDTAVPQVFDLRASDIAVMVVPG
jgi:hypothetical protein